MGKRRASDRIRTSSNIGRPTCYGCCRPRSHCVCKLVEPFEAHCRILILQHPHERRKYHSTTRILRAALSNCRLLRGIIFDESLLTDELAGQSAFLLFPTKSAQDCRTITLSVNSTVVVIDGTWEEARKIVFRNPILHTLPQITFSDSVHSNYRIRKQPRDNYLSTLESITHLLKVNAESDGNSAFSARYDQLTHGFNQMVEQQLRYFPRHALDAC